MNAESPGSDEDDEDYAVKFFNDVPKGPQPAKAGIEHEEKEMQKAREKDACNKKQEKKEDERRKTAADEAERRKTENADEEEDSDVAEDVQHPVNEICKARIIRPKLKFVPASKKRKHGHTEYAVQILTCGWRAIGGSYQKSFDDLVFTGRSSVLERLKAGMLNVPNMPATNWRVDTDRISVYIDCRSFHSEESWKLTPHLGHHIRILELIAEDPKLVEVFREAIWTLQASDEANLPSDIMMVCTSGIHRGPATGLLLYEMMLRDGREMGYSGPRNLSKNTTKWLRKCDSCVGCTDTNGRKALFDK